MSYAKAVQKYDDKKPEIEVRTDYRCKAHGCRNAGTMERDLCFFHAQAASTNWPEVTEKIDATWPEMANWGQAKTELEAAKAAARRASRPALKARGFGVIETNPGDSE